MGTLKNTIDKFYLYLQIIKISDVLDILIITFFVYKALNFIKGTRTVQLIKGLIVFGLIFEISHFMNFHSVVYVLSAAIRLGFIAVLVMFQPELRKVLEHFGRTSMGRWFNPDKEKDNEKKFQIMAEIVRGVEMLSNSKTGALIVFEGDVKIGDIIGNGIKLNSVVSAELLINIFVPRTPLHDGAVIIKDRKFSAAACFLPLSQNPILSKKLGTRHRAGIGISEESDAFAIIVSEETGKISLAFNGELTVDLTKSELNKMFLEKYIGKVQSVRQS